MRVMVCLALLVLAGSILAFGCWELHCVLHETALNLEERRLEADIVKDWLAIALSPIAALLGTAVAFFYIDRQT